jgi:hypothetical protein
MQDRVIPDKERSRYTLVKFFSQYTQPFNKNFRMFNLALEVHQVPIKSKLFGYFSKFLSIEHISIFRLLGEREFLFFQIRMI